MRIGADGEGEYEDAFNPDRERWEEEVEDAIERGVESFDLEAHVRWEDEDGFHSDVFPIHIDADDWDDFLSSYYDAVRDILDEVGDGTTEDGAVGVAIG